MDKLINNVDVLVSITLSKRVKITTPNRDLTEKDLEDLVTNQIVLPQDASTYVEGYAYEAGYTQSIREAEDLRGWNVDEFTVIPEEK